MKSSYPRLRAIRPTRCNPILTVITIREIAEHNGANVITSFRDQRGYGVRFSYSSPLNRTPPEGSVPVPFVTLSLAEVAQHYPRPAA